MSRCYSWRRPKMTCVLHVFMMTHGIKTPSAIGVAGVSNLRKPSSLHQRSIVEQGNLQGRRSIFGFFCRRCFVTYIKLSFIGSLKLQQDYQAWCNGNTRAGYEPIVKDQWNNGLHPLHSVYHN